MNFPNFESNKLGGPGKIVQIDETMLSYKCKSRRGKSALNKTDALCRVEVSQQITRVFACVIEDKRASKILPIIISQVAANSVIWTDEHRPYAQSVSYGFRTCHSMSQISICEQRKWSKHVVCGIVYQYFEI